MASVIAPCLQPGGAEREGRAAERFEALGASVPAYLDRPASREEAMADTTPGRYAALAGAFDAARG